MRNLVVYTLLVLIVVVGFNLRRFSFAQVPQPGDTADEYSFGWVGLSLIQQGYPIAWSGVAPYEHDYQIINVDNVFGRDPTRLPFPIDKPWFDHPPLFGLFVGGFAYLSGARDFVDASVLLLRKPMVILGTLNIVLIFILASIIQDKILGLVSAASYSLAPIVVISSRLALAENGYIPLFLTAVISAVLYIKNSKSIFWYFACVLAGIALLFKVSGISVAIALFLIVVVTKKKLDLKVTLPLIASVFSAIALFIIYGAYFDFDLFVKVLAMNSGRILGAGSELFTQAITAPRIATLRTFSDGWNLVGWISLFMLFMTSWQKDFSTKIILACVLAYFLVFMVFGGEPYGWYRFPFLPFLVIASAKIFLAVYTSTNLILGYMLFLIPFGNMVHRLLGLQGFQKYASSFKLMTMVVIGIFVFNSIFKNKLALLTKILLIGMFLSLLYLSYKSVYFYDALRWTSSS